MDTRRFHQQMLVLLGTQSRLLGSQQRLLLLLLLLVQLSASRRHTSAQLHMAWCLGLRGLLLLPRLLLLLLEGQ
jgi:hypothetical protein